VPVGHWQRTVEEALGGHGEELAFVGRAVLVQERGPVVLGGVDQFLVLGGHDFLPAAPLRVVLQGRRAVDDAVEHVELMGELVEDQVLAVARMLAVLQHFPPRQDHRS